MQLLPKCRSCRRKSTAMGQLGWLLLLASCPVAPGFAQSAPQQTYRTVLDALDVMDGSLLAGLSYPNLVIYGVGAALLSILGLVLWNRKLRRAAERRTAALQASESRLRAILEAEPECVAIFAADGRLLEMNQAGLKMLGAASLEQLQRQPLLELIVAEHRDSYLQLQEKLLRGESATVEFEIINCNGERRWLRMHGAPLRDEIRNLTALLGVTSDITERKKAEALTAGQKRVLEMIASGAALNTTLDALLRVVEAQSPEMLGSIMLLQPDGIRLQHGASPSLPIEYTRSIDGYAIGPTAGACGTAIFRRERVVTADIANDPLWADYQHLALPFGLRACWSTPIFGTRDEVLGSFAIYYHQPGGPPEAHLTLIAAATHTAAVCINNHRTEQALRDSEARFREVVENIEEAVWVKAADTNELLYISPGYEKIWGRSCASLYAAPQSWPDAIHSDDRERVRHAVSSQQGTRGYDEEYRIVRPDGAVRWIHNRSFPIRNAAGAIYRVAGVAEDITERHELEEQFRQAQKLEAVGALASGIAHDFNNILSAIQGNTELALEDVEPEHPAQGSLREILKASGRARNLVQQILTFTRTQQPEMRVIALGPVVEETEGFLRVMLPSNVELHVNLAADAPNVLGNATQIQQALWNLCTNAWHALAGQRGRIDIELRRVRIEAGLADVRRPAPGLYACLTVSDTGKGMDGATLEKIFKPFFTTKTAGNGTGLGLSITQDIVKSHGGAIAVDSVLDKGSKFQLYFPGAARSADALPLATPASRRGAGQHILYVDDEEALVLLTTRIFERLGYRVSGYTEAQRALDAFRADPDQYDLALTDFNMAGTSGLEVASELMTIRPDLPVILTSGYVTDDLREKARRTGIREVIYKPNSVQEFCDAVQRAMD